ncbi:MAG: aminotransferase class I/II-fold pyridoxal phosphate-dependent enzyme [Desulfosudaceae bacterium]
MSDKFHFIDEEFERRRRAGQVRRLRPVQPLDGAGLDIDGRRLINFCANDYLGLSRHPLLPERAAVFMAAYGAGSTASRLVCGNYACMDQVEKKLAAAKQAESALLFSSGYQANATLLPALADRDTLIFSDRLNHNSIIAGCRLARCAVRQFAHNDPADLAEQLRTIRPDEYSRIIIVTETVFSMDGDCCRLDDLLDLAERYDALLVVDEAHATGVFGTNGMGLADGRPVDAVMGTFGKSGGSFGAYVAGSEKLRQYLINCCAGFIYTTALPPAVIGEIDAALDLIPQLDAERIRLLETAEHLRSRLGRAGFDTGASASQIIPVIIGAESDALDLAGYLEEQGFLAVAIRPPSVPPGRSRIRISLSALHTEAEVAALAAALEQWSPP